MTFPGMQRHGFPVTQTLGAAQPLPPRLCLSPGRWRVSSGWPSGEDGLGTTMRWLCPVSAAVQSPVPAACCIRRDRFGGGGRNFRKGHSFSLASFAQGRKKKKEGRKKKKERGKKRQMTIFFSLQLMEERRACSDLSPRFACLEGKRKETAVFSPNAPPFPPLPCHKKASLGSKCWCTSEGSACLPRHRQQQRHLAGGAGGMSWELPGEGAARGAEHGSRSWAPSPHIFFPRHARSRHPGGISRPRLRSQLQERGVSLS